MKRKYKYYYDSNSDVLHLHFEDGEKTALERFSKLPFDSRYKDIENDELWEIYHQSCLHGNIREDSEFIEQSMIF